MSQQNHVKPALLKLDSVSSELQLSSIKDINRFMAPKRFIYWSDFLFSSILGNFFIYLACISEAFSFQQITSICIASIVLFRSAIFIHEAFHVGKEIKGFVLAYNLLFGFLHKLPFYCYTPHGKHHAVQTYGTVNDPEYDLVVDKPGFLIFPVFTSALLPIFALIRYGFLPALLPFIGKRNRDWIYCHASSLVMNLKFKRSSPNRKETIEWYTQDSACFVYNLFFLVLMTMDILPWKLLSIWSTVFYGVYLLNFYRVITSHHYLSNANKTTKKQQILDSGTIPNALFSFFLFPLGQRYHALHHLYPQMPYHNLASAHSYLIGVLPANHPYHLSIKKNYTDAIRRLISLYKMHCSLLFISFCFMVYG